MNISGVNNVKQPQKNQNKQQQPPPPPPPDLSDIYSQVAQQAFRDKK